MATVKSSQVNITDLDFDDIASNLKEYLKGQSTLKDYNFEGSNISLLIDLLAYSSHVSHSMQTWLHLSCSWILHK